MKIGLKFDVGFAQDEVYRQLYGGREVLPFLKQQGVELVETPIGPETDMQALMEHIRLCVEAGLKVSLHPYSEGSIFNLAFFTGDGDNPCRELHERFFRVAAEAARLQQFPTLVNLHGAAGTPGDCRQHLLERSIAFFSWARQWCSRSGPGVQVTVELQITDTSPEIKGATATNQLKDATLETGLATRVPAFIKIGETVKISTEDGSYIGRAAKE